MHPRCKMFRCCPLRRMIGSDFKTKGNRRNAEESSFHRCGNCTGVCDIFTNVHAAVNARKYDIRRLPSHHFANSKHDTIGRATIEHVTLLG